MLLSSGIEISRDCFSLSLGSSVCLLFLLSGLIYSYKLVKMLSVCVSVWMLTKAAQIITDIHTRL